MGNEFVDKVTSARIAQAHPKVRSELEWIMAEANRRLDGRAKCRLAYVLRSFAEQAALYAQGRQPVASVNSLRAAAGLPAISQAQNQAKVTKAPAGLSIHQYALAADIVLLVDKDGNGTYESAAWDTSTDFDKDGVSDWMEVVAVFKSKGWTWGGDFRGFVDMPHFEKTFGHTPSDLLAVWKAGKKDASGYVLLS